MSAQSDLESRCCPEFPIFNLSAEAPDHDRNISIINFNPRPPLGWTYLQVGCQRICASDISQDAADDCAAAQAANCVYNNWVPPTPPNTPQFPPRIYSNVEQTCTIFCSDGEETTPGENTFSWTVPAGTVLALSQAIANKLAHARACQLARQNRICILTQTLREAACGTAYEEVVVAIGGVPSVYPHVVGPQTPFPFGFCSSIGPIDQRVANIFAPIPYVWDIIAGTLPAGLTLNECTGTIHGTPTVAGDYTFTIRARDNIGSQQTKAFTLTVTACSQLFYWAFEDATAFNAAASKPIGVDFSSGSNQPLATGKIGQGRHFPYTKGGFNNTIGTSYLSQLAYEGGGFSFWTWIKVNEKGTAKVGFPFRYVKLLELDFLVQYVGFNNLLNVFWDNGVTTKSEDFAFNAVIGQWHLLQILYLPTGFVKVKIDNGVTITSTQSLILPHTTSTELAIRSQGGIISSPPEVDFDIDEWGFFKGRVLNEVDMAAIWNGGAGITWPAVGLI